MASPPSLVVNNNNNYNNNNDPIIRPRDVCIVGVARTPIGDFLGSLSSFSATQLGSLAIRCALERAHIDPQLVQEVFFGNVLSANLGQAPARQAALGAGIPHSVVCTTINKVCSSGLKATMLAAQSIQVGANDIVVAGGMESMSNAPKYLTSSRTGSRFGHDSIIDGMIKDGLWDVYNDFGMGVCAELCADTYNITRQHQDNYAIRSFNRGISAQNNGAFAWEIVPVKVSGGRSKVPTVVDKDEALTKFDATKLRNLRPSFKVKGGSVTAGNASSIRYALSSLKHISAHVSFLCMCKHGFLFSCMVKLVCVRSVCACMLIEFVFAPSFFMILQIFLLDDESTCWIVISMKYLWENHAILMQPGENSDGAAALVLVSGETASKLGLQVIAKIRGFAEAAQAPELFTTAPALAIPKAISNAGLKASQIDYYEINEAFSVVALANQKLLGIVDEQINVHGGAVSLGHPLGCSGARILVTLLGVLRQNNGRLGVAGICNGGGGASALVLELMPTPRMSHSRL